MKKALILLLTIFCCGSLAWAEAVDRYAPIYREGSTSPSGTQKVLNEFLTYPFEIVRWPISKSLVAVEKYKLDKKLKWFYEELQEQGISPRFSLFSSPGVGSNFDLIRLSRQKDRLPDLVAHSWIDWRHDRLFEVGAEVGAERIGGSGFNTFGLFEYSERPEEHFYGIGPNTSGGDGTSFRMETTKLEARTGYRWIPMSLSADVKYGYHNINITDGEDDGRGIIDTTFDSGSIPGLDGDELVSLGFEITHDTRNHKGGSTKGGLERFGWTYFEGIDGSEARYFQYQVELARYFSLGTPRRVFAFHFYGEHNDELDDHQIPFHQMAKLGGFGNNPSLSHPMRGFTFNRFFDESALLFNLEYRYTVWEYRDLKADSVLFFDLGQVFGEFTDFQFKDFRESYGLGLRFSVANHVLLSVEVAHSDEGTNFYAKSTTPF